jgi:hypothetical protein
MLRETGSAVDRAEHSQRSMPCIELVAEPTTGVHSTHNLAIFSSFLFPFPFPFSLPSSSQRLGESADSIATVRRAARSARLPAVDGLIFLLSLIKNCVALFVVFFY